MLFSLYYFALAFVVTPQNATIPVLEYRYYRWSNVWIADMHPFIVFRDFIVLCTEGEKYIYLNWKANGASNKQYGTPAWECVVTVTNKLMCVVGFGCACMFAVLLGIFVGVIISSYESRTHPDPTWTYHNSDVKRYQAQRKRNPIQFSHLPLHECMAVARL